MVNIAIDIEDALLAREMQFFAEQATPELTDKYGSGHIVLTLAETKSADHIQLMLPVSFPKTILQIEDVLLKTSLKERKSFTIDKDIKVDRYQKILIYKDQQVELTEKEVAILDMLAHSDKDVSRDELLSHIWGYQEGLETHTLETHIYRLRQKLENEINHDLILTKEGGYCLRR